MFEDRLTKFVIDHPLELTPDVIRKHADVMPLLLQASLINELDARTKKIPDIFLYYIELITSYDSALFYIWDPEHEWYCRGLEGEIPDNIEKGNMFTEYVKQTGHPLLVSESAKLGEMVDNSPIEFSSMMAMPVYLDTNVIGCVELYRRDDLPFDIHDMALVKNLLLYSEKAMADAFGPEKYIDESLKVRMDVPQKHTILDVLHQYEEQARRLSYPLSVAIVTVNPENQMGIYRDLSGSIRTLKSLARHMRNGLRCYDKVLRYEEASFFVILPGCSSKEAFTAMESVRKQMGEELARNMVTGIASMPYETQDAKGLISGAHQAVSYAVKHGLKTASFSQTGAAKGSNMSLELDLMTVLGSGPSMKTLELILELVKTQCHASEVSFGAGPPGKMVKWAEEILGYARYEGLAPDIADWVISYLSPAWAVEAGKELDHENWDLGMLSTASILSDLRAGYPVGYSLKVADQMYTLARTIGKSHETAMTWANTAMAANIGYLGISTSVFTKDEISPFDKHRINSHPIISARMLKRFATLDLDADMLVYHHEHLDGTGYPRGLRGDEIPLSARALRVVDTFNAMTSPRLYRGSKLAGEALSELSLLAGKSLDPELTKTYSGIICS